MDWTGYDFPRDIRLDPDDIAERAVLHGPRSDKVMSRIGIMFSLYFTEGWTKQRRQATLDVLREYLELFGDGVTHFQYANERRMRKYSGTGLPPRYEEILEAKEDEDTYLFVQNRTSSDDDDPSHYLFMALGTSKRDPRRKLSGVKIHLPPDFVFSDPQRTIELLKRWSQMLSVLHGSGGLAALSNPGNECSTDAYWLPWLVTYPALEYDDMGGYKSEARGSQIGWQLARSSNWLTILGDENIERVDGRNAIRDQLTPGMQLEEYENGVVIRASELPALGNPETGGIPEGYRTAARIIKPIRFEAYEYGVIATPKGVADGKEEGVKVTLDWLRRLD